MGFSQQEYWSGWPCPPPGDLPDPGMEPMSLTSPALAGRLFTTSITWKALQWSPVVVKCVKYDWPLSRCLGHYTQDVTGSAVPMWTQALDRLPGTSSSHLSSRRLPQSPCSSYCQWSSDMSTRKQIHRSSLVAQMVKKICLQGQETRVHPWVRKIPLEKATNQAHSGNVETKHQGLCLTSLQRAPWPLCKFDHLLSPQETSSLIVLKSRQPEALCLQSKSPIPYKPKGGWSSAHASPSEKSMPVYLTSI